MKHLRRIFIVTLVLGLGLTAWMLIKAPARLPVHWNIAGEVDRIGSKWEYLIAPGIMLFTSAILLITSAAQAKTDQKNAKIILISGIFINILLGALQIFFLRQAMKYAAALENGGAGEVAPSTAQAASAAALSGDVLRLLPLIFGVLLLGMGFLLPRVKPNHWMGIRTPWTLSSDEVWQKTHRFSGLLSMACGLVVLVGILLLPAKTSIILAIVVMMLWTLVSVVASYVFFRSFRR